MPLRSPARVLRDAKEAMWAVYASPRLLHPLDRLVSHLPTRRAAGAGAVAGQGAHVLVCPPGAGNIGDQAMVEAFLGQTAGPAVLVVRGADDVSVPAEQAGRVTVLVLPKLVYGGGAGHVRDTARFSALLSSARSVSVVGADLMDGGYGHRPAANLAHVAGLAASRGVPSRVLGFSWNGRAHPSALAAVRSASLGGTRLMVRDPLSAQRARHDGLLVEEVTDTVFSASSDLDPAAADRLLGPAEDDGALVAVVNASGLVGSRVEQLPDLRAVVAHLRRHGVRVVLLPHVSRPGGDDVAEVSALADSCRDDPGVVLVDGLLPPAQVRGLVDRADVVLTGRMHLAIMALSRGVPAICLSTQGKVDGLMQLFGVPSLSVQPRVGMAGELTRLLDEVLDGTLAAVDRLPGLAEAARLRSHANFAGLDAA